MKSKIFSQMSQATNGIIMSNGVHLNGVHFFVKNFTMRLILIAAILASCAASASAFGPPAEFVKKINREFGTNASGMTALYNKYGQVNVKTWANNAVKIDITITINAGTQRDADAMFEKIQVNFTNTSGYVKAETMIAQTNNWWGQKSDNFKIDYEVFMPVGNQLDLKNRYGNAFVSDLDGKLMAEIKYGDLRAENLRADADLYLSYGKAFISKVQNLYGQISYGELRLTEGKDLQMDTKYSDLNIDRAGAVRITSKYDDFDLGTIDDLRLQTKYADIKTQTARAAYITAQYSDVKIGNVTEVLDADQSYGSLRVDILGRNVQDVNLTGKYTDYKIALEKGASCRFEIEYHHADVKVPSSANIRSEREENNSKFIKGSLSDSNAKCLIKAKLQYGGFILR